MNRGDQMRSPLKARSRLESFRHAFAGLWYVLRTQRNAWIHAFVTVGVIFLGLWLQIGFRDWALIILAIFVVWLAEIINTALEAITDLASPEVHPLARAVRPRRRRLRRPGLPAWPAAHARWES